MPSPNAAGDAVNMDELNEIMDNDLELIRECFTDFIREWPVQYVEIKSAVLEKNGRKINESAHKLKGTLKYLAAEKASQAAYCLESAGKESDFSGITEKLENLKNECRRVVDYIKDFNP